MKIKFLATITMAVLLAFGARAAGPGGARGTGGGGSSAGRTSSTGGMGLGMGTPNGSQTAAATPGNPLIIGPGLNSAGIAPVNPGPVPAVPGNPLASGASFNSA